ncbi:MAG: amino acid permease [Candidatus Omnitrophota bacterium]
MNSSAPDSSPSMRTLGVFDVVSIIVGIIVGSGIFMIPAWVAGLMGSPGLIMLAWFLGGLLSLAGALCYAELASTYPREGGDYYFLNRAYGSWAGFLYAWGRLLVIHTGNIACMSYIAGTYAARLFPFPHADNILTLSAIIILTTINCLGVREGKWTQNILAAAQTIGLFGVVIVGFLVSAPSPEPPMPGGFSLESLLMALIFVQFCFGGWSDCAFVASEVKEPEKNILRSLVIGTLLVTVVYLLVNGAILHALGVQLMAASKTAIADVLSLGFGKAGTVLVCLLAMTVALSSANGMILTGGRIFHAFGEDHALFRILGTRNRRFHTPAAAMIAQGVIASILALSGRFEDLVTYTASAHWLFMTAIGAALFLFRRREPDIERPYRTSFYPLTPLVYIASCLLLLFGALNYARSSALLGFLIVLSGLPAYALSQRREKIRSPNAVDVRKK